jgi:hypothetical protein
VPSVKLFAEKASSELSVRIRDTNRGKDKKEDMLWQELQEWICRDVNGLR